MLIHRLGQRMPWYMAADTVEGRNIRNLYAETTWFGVLNGLVGTFMSVFALRLGATTAQVGWLAALPALVNVVWLIPAGRIIERQRRRQPLILWAGFLQRLGYLLLAAMPFLLATGQVEALIVINTLITLPAAIINTAITALIPDLTSKQMDQVQVIRDTFLPKVNQIRQNLRRERAELARLLFADPPDREGISAIARQIIEHQSELENEVIEHILEEREILSPSQQRKFYEIIIEQFSSGGLGVHDVKGRP